MSRKKKLFCSNSFIMKWNTWTEYGAVNSTRNCALENLSMKNFHYEPSEIELSGRPFSKFIKVMISVIKTKFPQLWGWYSRYVDSQIWFICPHDTICIKWILREKDVKYWTGLTEDDLEKQSLADSWNGSNEAWCSIKFGGFFSGLSTVRFSKGFGARGLITDKLKEKKINVFWDVVLCSSGKNIKKFWKKYFFLFQYRRRVY